MTRPTRPPTTVPLMRMNWRSRPTASSIPLLASSGSHGPPAGGGVEVAPEVMAGGGGPGVEQPLHPVEHLGEDAVVDRPRHPPRRLAGQAVAQLGAVGFERLAHLAQDDRQHLLVTVVGD